ncbi:unnamed protein product [Caenorhabditis auriculariae]|uniref:RRM domain-containing protein n=1 Tax=Caenorhabditis auriculariae TaxID=2777116 RepID=A0A8S1HKD4_9PELO|nr:unnamed protein product [Caenorhabditis auriculariae]
MLLCGDNSHRTLWIDNVPTSWDTEKLKAVFEKYGQKPYKVSRVDLRGEIQLYCFVEFVDNDSAHRAMDVMTGKKVLDGKRANISFAFDNHNPEHRLNISSLPENVREIDLFKIFRKYRSYRGAKLHKSGHYSSGFLRFGDQTDQQQALVELNRKKIDHIKLNLTLGRQKDERLRHAARMSANESFNSYSPVSLHNMSGYNSSFSCGSNSFYQPSPQFQSPMSTMLSSSYASPQMSSASLFSKILHPPLDPLAPLPDDEQLDPTIRLAFLPSSAKNAKLANKDLICHSNDIFNDLECSRWSPFAYTKRVTPVQFEERLVQNGWMHLAA